MKRFILISILYLLTQLTFAQLQLWHVEPSHWWVGMRNSNLQVMVHGDQVGMLTPYVKSKHVLLKKVHKAESINYLFLDLEILPDAKAGYFKIEFLDGSKKIGTYNYQLKERREGSADRIGFDQSDVIYLLMPDRFSNGDSGNDSHPEMLEKVNRDDKDGRHGGDIKGIKDHLNYIDNSGFTAIWINPLLENNQSKYSYHGYAISDFYEVDPRFGSNEDYKKLVEECHKRGIQVINDMVFNHCGSGHWWMNDLPFTEWIHQHQTFTKSNFRSSVIVDPYVSDYDQKKMLTGWFDKNMPDLNQHNPFLATYLIQNSIWWVEYADLDGIRVDTYPYPFKDFMAEWARRLMEEYPNLRILGEIWVGNPSIVSYWKNHENVDDYQAGINSVFDFPLYDNLIAGLNEQQGWSTGITRLYDVLSTDFLYENPSENVVFCDNHDVSRIGSIVNDDIDKLKLAYTFILTTRGIPSILYGSEMGMSGKPEDGHGEIRSDFPGGWEGDSVNLFHDEQRSVYQNELYGFISGLIHWRNQNPVIHSGKLKHFIPYNDVYVYFRYNDQKTVMVILNKNEKEQDLSLPVFEEMLQGKGMLTDVLTGNKFTLDQGLIIPGMTSMVLEVE